MPRLFWRVIIAIAMAVSVALGFFVLLWINHVLPGRHHRLEHMAVLLPFGVLLVWLVRLWRRC